MSDYESYKANGNLYVNEYYSEGKPHFTGYIEVTKEQIECLISKGKSGQDVKLQLACWKYPSKKNPNQIRLFLVSEVSEKQRRSSKPAPKNDWDEAGDFGDVPF